jgi:hypothetical protein
MLHCPQSKYDNNGITAVATLAIEDCYSSTFPSRLDVQPDQAAGITPSTWTARPVASPRWHRPRQAAAGARHLVLPCARPIVSVHAASKGRGHRGRLHSSDGIGRWLWSDEEQSSGSVRPLTHRRSCGGWGACRLWCLPCHDHVMDFELDPPHGVGPLRIGMPRAEADSALMLLRDLGLVSPRTVPDSTSSGRAAW